MSETTSGGESLLTDGQRKALARLRQVAESNNLRVVVSDDGEELVWYNSDDQEFKRDRLADVILED
jgi:hypothetical protein